MKYLFVFFLLTVSVFSQNLFRTLENTEYKTTYPSYIVENNIIYTTNPNTGYKDKILFYVKDYKIFTNNSYSNYSEKCVYVFSNDKIYVPSQVNSEIYDKCIFIIEDNKIFRCENGQKGRCVYIIEKDIVYNVNTNGYKHQAIFVIDGYIQKIPLITILIDIIY